jgi:outer membrane biosynthesis protein TonB
VIADSSQLPILDNAAKRIINDLRFKTSCPGTRFDLRMRFTLRDRYLEPSR